MSIRWPYRREQRPALPSSLGEHTDREFQKIENAIRELSESSGALSVTWGDVVGKPSTFPPSAHSHVISDVTGLQSALDSKQPLATVLTNTTAAFTTAQETKLAGIAAGATANATDAALRDRSTHTGSQAIATITGLETALASKLDDSQASAFGLSLMDDADAASARTTLGLGSAATTASGDYAPAAHVTSGGTAHATVTTSAAGFMSATDKAKLDGVASGATANATDAALRDRSSHTGSQAISTVTGLQAALDDKAPTSHIGSGGAAHADASTSVSGFMSAADKSKLDGVASGATANATDAQLRDRSTHTGTQNASTITGTLAVANGGTGVTTSTGTGAVVLSNSPTLVTPTLGAASVTSIAADLGAVGTPSYTFTGDLNTGIFSPAADTLAFVEGGVEAMRIDSSGRVGIGTTAPNANLHVLSSGTVTARLTTTGAATQSVLSFGTVGGSGTVEMDQGGNMVFRSQQSSMFFDNFGTGSINFRTGGANTRIAILSTGEVGIGTSSPERRLHVVSNQPLRMGTATDWFQFTQTNNNIWGWLSSLSVYPMVMNGSTGNVGFGTLSPSGRVHAVNSYSNSSDATYIAEGNIPGINIRATGGGRFSILSNFGATNTTSIALGTGTNNPSETMRFDHASGAVIVGTGAPNAAAQFQVDSVVRGFLPPRMSTAQRDAITSPPDGLVLYNNSTNKLQVRAAGAWVDLH